MSVELAKQEIMRFLASAEREVLCFKGRWGVGKTHAWKKYLEEARDRSQLGLSHYSYVSLFGLGSLDEVRVAILENRLPRERLHEAPSANTLLNNPLAVGVHQWSRMLPLLESLPFIRNKAVRQLIQSLSFLNVREQIVCLDDLERKSDTLKIRDVLGLVSQLAESRECKVVLILNDEAFQTGSEKDDFKLYFEKATDSHVEFRPSPEDCVLTAAPCTTPAS